MSCSGGDLDASPLTSPSSSPVTVDSLDVVDHVSAWRRAGFTVIEHAAGTEPGYTTRIGTVTVHITEPTPTSPKRGVRSWNFHIHDPTAATITTTTAPLLTRCRTRVTHSALQHNTAAATIAHTFRHPNGVTRFDHIAIITDSLESTKQSFLDIHPSLTPRRPTKSVPGRGQLTFWRIGDVIIEVVAKEPEKTESTQPNHPSSSSSFSSSSPPRANIWGLAFRAPDILATKQALDINDTSDIRAAMQPGRRVMTIKTHVGLCLPCIFISPPPSPSSSSSPSLPPNTPTPTRVDTTSSTAVASSSSSNPQLTSSL